MFKNYLKITIRNIRKQKIYSFINIAGLAIGLACTILIFLWVFDELSYDRYHEKANRIYRLCFGVNSSTSFRSPATMAPAAPAMIEEFPEVVNAVRIERYGKASVKYEDRLFLEEHIYLADNSFFEIFSFPFIDGDPKTALNVPFTVVITEDMARKYFGDESPLGKIVKIDGEFDFTVTGIVKNVRQNSHFRFNMVGSFQTLYALKKPEIDNWLNIEYYTYLLLSEHTDYEELENKFPDLIEKHVGERLRAMNATMDLFLQPLTKIHLYSDFRRDFATIGNITYVYLFSGIAIFILFLACINFINLSTARSATRAQEVGVRKTLGAFRQRLIGQFLSESVIFSLVALIFAILLVEILLPSFNTQIDRQLSLGIFRNPWLIFTFIGLALLVGMLAGSYPAFYLSAFQPIQVLKGNLVAQSTNARFRNGLVVFQFVVSIALIIGSMTLSQQINFLRNKSLGFEKEQILVIPRMNDELRKSYRSIQDEMRQIPGIIDISASSLVPGRGNLIQAILPEGFEDPQRMDYMHIDHNYIPLMEMNIVAGRNFSRELVTDMTESVIINETAANQFGWNEPIGKKFIFRSSSVSEGGTIFMHVIGVVKDFHRMSLHRKIEPLILYFDPESFNYMSLKISPDNLSHTIELIKKKWQEIDPLRPFDYFFLNDALDMQYRLEERIGKISFIFSLLAIFIGCLGLLGLTTFMTEQRTKEIGIRKVLGASRSNIMFLLSKEFTRWVLAANIISWPIAYLIMNNWLHNFAYRINMNMLTFFIAGAITVLIAFITVSYQAIRAAVANPIEALRYE